MKSWIILISLAVGLTAASTVAVSLWSTGSSSLSPGIPAPDTSNPRAPAGAVEVEGELTHKFGSMAQDIDGSHAWTFVNTGPGPLELRNLGTDCSCTVAELGKPGPEGSPAPEGKVMPPGTREPITVKWNTRKVDGAYRKSARIGTNDPKRPEITLVVEGTVHPAVSLFPPDRAINYQAVSNDEPHKRSIALFSADRPETKVTRLVSSNPGLIGVESRPMTEEEAGRAKVPKGHVIEVTLKMAAKLGPFAEEVLIETDHPLGTEIRITVLGRLDGPITLTPDRISLRDVPSSDGAGLDLTAWVRGRNSAEFTVLDKPEWLDVAISPVAQPAGTKGSKYQMHVKVLPGAPAGRIVGEVVLKTDHPQATEVRVPVDVLVRGTR